MFPAGTDPGGGGDRRMHPLLSHHQPGRKWRSYETADTYIISRGVFRGGASGHALPLRSPNFTFYTGLSQ